jgi:hypothetical protein
MRDYGQCLETLHSQIHPDAAMDLKRIDPLLSSVGQLARPLPSIKSIGSFALANTSWIPIFHDPEERA